MICQALIHPLTLCLLMKAANPGNKVDRGSCHLMLFADVFREALGNLSNIIQVILTIYKL